MGVYRLCASSNGESRIEEFSPEALQDLKVVGTMSFSVQERPPSGSRMAPYTPLALVTCV